MRLPVHIEKSVVHGDRVAANGDHSLDERVRPWAAGRVENDDVPYVRCMEVIHEAVHQDPVAFHERWLHGRGRDDVRLHQELLDEEGENESGRHDDGHFDHPA